MRAHANTGTPLQHEVLAVQLHASLARPSRRDLAALPTPDTGPQVFTLRHSSGVHLGRVVLLGVSSASDQPLGSPGSGLREVRVGSGFQGFVDLSADPGGPQRSGIACRHLAASLEILECPNRALLPEGQGNPDAVLTVVPGKRDAAGLEGAAVCVGWAGEQLPCRALLPRKVASRLRRRAAGVCGGTKRGARASGPGVGSTRG